jgi:eukaryotic-like serine/threonine-protein kinase
MPLSQGTRLGPYEITELLGAGGMGEVYRAKDSRLDRSVAIKVLPPHIAADEEGRQRFDREARAIAGLNHPHICVLHDVGHDNGTDYLVMEHLQGQTLADRLKKGPLPVDQAVRYAIEIADALDKAHRQGIVHRDLKPANIMITKAGAKLLDFGLAKLRATARVAGGFSELPTEGVALTSQGTLVGTLQYMAPEQLEGKEADGRTDIFALGAVLYEMVTGTKAFDGKSQVSLIASIMEHDPRRISEVQPLSPPALEQLIQGCLAKSPDDRWQTAHDVMKQLKWIEASGMRTGTSTGVAFPRRRVAWAVVLAAAVVAGAATVVGLRYLRSPGVGEETRFPISTPDMPNPVQVSVSPDGRRIAFVAVRAGGTPVLFIRPLNAVEAQPLAGTENAFHPFWSPDSRSIGFFAQGKLKRIDTAGGPPQNICDAGVNGLGGTWNANGVIVFGSFPGPLKRVSASGGEPVPVTALNDKGEAAHAWPFFLPDGLHFLYVAVSTQAADARAIYAGSLDSTDRVQVLRTLSMPVYAPPGYLLFHRDGALMAQPFDVKKFALSGEPARLADSVVYIPNSGRAGFAVSNTGTLVFRTGDSGAQTQLTWYSRAGKSLGTVGIPADQYRHVALSPDGKQLAVHRHQEPSGGSIWVWDQDRGTFTRFTISAAHDSHPLWSPDGKFIAFDSDREGGIFNLYQKSSSGAGTDELILKTERTKFLEDFTPDGKTLTFFTADPKTGGDIWSLPTSGDRKPQPLITMDFAQVFSKFSPDGRWLAYASNESGRFEVFVQPFPEGTSRWQISTQGGHYPRWARTGKELFYFTEDGTLMSVDVQAEGTVLKASTPRVLFKSNVMFGNHNRVGGQLDMPYEVSADGQRFLINERLVAANQNTPITVVLNWAAALKK